MTEDADGPQLPLVAVAVGKEKKSSQSALKWALENITTKSQTLFLVYVNTKHPSGQYEDQEVVARDVLVPYRCFCKRKSVVCKDIILEDNDVAKAIVDLVANSSIEKLVVGGSKGGFVRSFRSTDIGTVISKNAPDFCTVYIISKGKVSSVRNALRSAPAASTLRSQIPKHPKPAPALNQPSIYGDAAGQTLNPIKEREAIKSPFDRRPRFSEETLSCTDISFVTCGRRNVGRVIPARSSYSSDLDSSFESIRSPGGTYDPDSGVFSYSNDSLSSDDMKAKMDRLRLELKQTVDMCNTACREAHLAKQKAMEYGRWKIEEQQRLEGARVAEEAALAPADKERANCSAALEAAEATNRVAELEAPKRMDAEMNELEESKRENASNNFLNTNLRYRRYTIDEIEAATDSFAENRKIGEGGYGPVYRCHLDHTPVAIKVLRPDAAQGKAQFQQEVEILSCIRHPNMVILVGACPEYGCLVYEYMSRGSLEDCLLRRGNTPPIPWQHRFRIAAEIGTALLFLHNTKPEPLVHRDLKPANILLDQNYVSKIGDVGLARLIPPSVADSVTQYLITSAAGTFYYIDPEYQKTGMLGVKSDVYSFGVLLLQLITGRPPMALSHQVESSIEKDTFAEMLDPSIHDWPVEEALCLAKLALRCAELRRKDRPDLGTVVLPELNRLRDLGEENIQPFMFLNNYRTSPIHNEVYVQDINSEPLQSGYDSASQYGGSTIVGR